MSKTFELTKNELSIMEKLWTSDTPLTRTEIVDACKDDDWKSSSIHILLNQLLKKEAIQVAGFARTGNNYGRTFEATLTKDDYALMQLERISEENKPSKSALLKFTMAFLGGEDVDSDTLDSLEQIIKEKKKTL